MTGRTGDPMAQERRSRSWTRRAALVAAVAVLLSLSGVAWGAPPSTDRWCDNFGSEFPALCYPALVPKTGQTVVYYDGDDGDLQRGVEWPLRFTIIETDSGEPDGTVTDNLTGLIWLRDANCFGELSWYAALISVSLLEDGMCGLSDGSSQGDWRLPNIRELQSLIHYGFHSPALPNRLGTGKWEQGDPFYDVQWASFPVLVAYDSSTTVAWDADETWVMFFYNGQVRPGCCKDVPIFVWPVRGGQ